MHQDHQTIASEGLRAFKRTTILGYEIPWNNFDFSYQAYLALEHRHVERKVAALEPYASQQHRRYANGDYVWSVAAHPRHQREPRVRRGVPGVPRRRLTTTNNNKQRLVSDGLSRHQIESGRPGESRASTRTLWNRALRQFQYRAVVRLAQLPSSARSPPSLLRPIRRARRRAPQFPRVRS